MKSSKIDEIVRIVLKCFESTRGQKNEHKIIEKSRP